MAREVPTIKFVTKEDTQKALDAHGIRLDKNSKCSVCGDRITVQNIGAVVPRPDGNLFVCSKAKCVAISNVTGSSKGKEGRT